MIYSREHLSAALTWIERNHPGGIALVARALYFSFPGEEGPSSDREGKEPKDDLGQQQGTTKGR